MTTTDPITAGAAYWQVEYQRTSSGAALGEAIARLKADGVPFATVRWTNSDNGEHWYTKLPDYDALIFAKDLVFNAHRYSDVVLLLAGGRLLEGPEAIRAARF